MIEFRLVLVFLGLISVIKLVVLIDAVCRIVVLFQIVGILVSYKVSVSVIQLGSLVIGLSASLVVSYKSVFIISRVQFFIELTVVIINQNILIHVLSIIIGVDSRFLMTLFAMF